jgi:hypothetical protein
MISVTYFVYLGISLMTIVQLKHAAILKHTLTGYIICTIGSTANKRCVETELLISVYKTTTGSLLTYVKFMSSASFSGVQRTTTPGVLKLLLIWSHIHAFVQLAGYNAINTDNLLKCHDNLLKCYLLTYYCKQSHILLKSFL